MSSRRRSFRKGRRGISPVISTIIIVAVAIAISIAVAFWLGGITAIFTRFEKLEITSAYATATNSSDTWKIVISVKNTGTSDATITDILINNIPIKEYASQIGNTTSADNSVINFGTTYDDVTDGVSYPLKTGNEVEITFYIKSSTTYAFTAGQSVTITIHTAAGQDYPKTVALP